MRNSFYALFGVGCLLLSSSAFAGPAETQAVQARLAVQSRWLGQGAISAGWNKFLLTPQLEAELAKGNDADRQAVGEVIAKYTSQKPGLERKQFVAVRQALEAWLASLVTPADLPQAALDAKASYRAPEPQRLAAARTRVRSALAKLDTFLARNGGRNRADWHAYLQWEKLQAEVSKEQSPDLRVLQASQASFFQNESGLDLPAFLEARQALRDFNHLVLATSDADPQAAFAARVDDLSKRLDAYHKAPNDADAIAIGNALGYLAHTNQAPVLVSGVRSHFAQPNLYVHASERLASAGVNRPVNDVTPIHEVILGTDIYGTAHTRGSVSLRTVPSAQRAILEIVMSGHSRSNNVGYNRSVKIYSQGSTMLSASKRLLVDENGIAILPAVAVTHTDTQITGISAKRKIIEKIARKRVAQSKGEAGAIANQRAERRLRTRVDEQAAVDLARAADSYLTRFRRPLLRKDEFPRQLDFSTTSDSIDIVALHANASRLGAPTAPPAVNADDYDLVVRLHESIVGNGGETGIGGRTLTDERAAELVKEATGEVPEELQITEDKDPWSITFSPERPIAVKFADQHVTISIRGNRFTRGDREIKKDMIISATYKLEQQGSGSKLTRVGEVTAEYAGNPERQSLTEISFKTLMRKKFAALFKDEIASEGLKLPGRWASAGRLVLRKLDASNGWITLGWEMPDANPKVAQAK